MGGGQSWERGWVMGAMLCGNQRRVSMYCLEPDAAVF